MYSPRTIKASLQLTALLLALPLGCARASTGDDSQKQISAQVRDLLEEVHKGQPAAEPPPPMRNYAFIKGALFDPRKFDFGVPIGRMNLSKEVLVRYIDRSPGINWQPNRTDAQIAQLLVKECNPVFVELGLKDKPVVCDYLLAYASMCYWSRYFAYVGHPPELEALRTPAPGVRAWKDAFSSRVLNGMTRPRGVCRDIAVGAGRTINAASRSKRPNGTAYGMQAYFNAVAQRNIQAPDQIHSGATHAVIILRLKSSTGAVVWIPGDPGIYLGSTPGGGSVTSAMRRWAFLPLTREELNAFGWVYNCRENKRMKVGGLPMTGVWLKAQAEKSRKADYIFGGGLIYGRDVWPKLGASATDVHEFFRYLERTGPLPPTKAPEK